jgi:hypothetical protein
MKRFPFRPILIGALIGAVLFFAPFILFRILLIAFIVGLIFRIAGRRRYYDYHAHHRYAGMPADEHVLSLHRNSTRDIHID